MVEKANWSVEEAAQWLGVTSRTVYRLVQDGRLPGFKVGGQWRFNRTMLESWVASQVATKAGTASAGRRMRDRQ